MFDSPILEVIVGLIFVYSLLSILVTQINSIVSNFLKLRASYLRAGLDHLIQDPVMRAKVFTHPLVRLVKGDMVLPDQRIDENQAERITQRPLNDLTWLAPKTFTDVLISIIRVNTDRELFGTLLNIVDGMPSSPERRRLRLIVNKLTSSGEGLDDLRETIQSIREPMYREALTEALDLIDDEIGRLGLEPNSVISLMAGLRNIKNVYFRTALETILSTSQTLQEAEQQIGDWFNEGMNRATALFTQRMQAFSILIGLLIALILNVDTLQLARGLWEDPALRSAVAAAAQQADLGTLMQSAEGSDSSPQSAEDFNRELQASIEAARSTVDMLFDLRLPLGWRYQDLSGIDPAAPGAALLLADTNNLWNYLPGNNSALLSLLLNKLLGLAATTIAIAQGAPFWFNLLNRLTGGGKKD